MNSSLTTETDIIGSYRPRLANLSEDLVRVDLDIYAWRGAVPIAAGDLGLEESEEFDATLREYLRLGRKRLLPSRYANERERIERQARDALRYGSYETELGFLVPKLRWPTLREKLQGCKERYERLIHELTSAENYPLICDEIRSVYTKAAIQAWKVRQGLKAVTTAATDKPPPSAAAQSEFVHDFVARVVQAIPSPEAMRQKFSFQWTVRYLELPSRIEEELRQAELTRLQLQAEAERLEAQLCSQRAADAAEREKQRLELEAVRRRLAAEEAVAREVAEKTKAELEAQYGRASTLVESALRTMLYDLSVDVLGMVQKHGRLPGASAQRIRTLIERVRFLNYRDATDIEELVQKLEAVVPVDAAERNLEDITQALRDIGTVTRAELMALGERPRSGSVAGIDDVIDVARYQRARAALSVELPALPISSNGRSAPLRAIAAGDSLLL